MMRHYDLSWRADSNIYSTFSRTSCGTSSRTRSSRRTPRLGEICGFYRTFLYMIQDLVLMGEHHHLVINLVRRKYFVDLIIHHQGYQNKLFNLYRVQRYHLSQIIYLSRSGHQLVQANYHQSCSLEPVKTVPS